MIAQRQRALCRATLAMLCSSTAALGQTATPQNTRVDVNYVYASSLGFGGYSIGGLTANVYAIPLTDTFHDIPYDGWSLKFLLPIQVGLYDFKAFAVGQEFSLNQQSVTVVPGVELQIPVGDRLSVKPFFQAGAGHTFGASGGEGDAWVYLGGVRSVAEWHVGDYTLSLGNGAIYAADHDMGPGFGEHYISLQLAGEVRRPLGFKIGNLAPDLGVYAAEYYYPDPLKFSRFLRTELRVDNQNEIGFSIGSAEPLKLLWWSDPRIGAGVVFGGGLTVYHVNFGFPF